MVKLKQVRELPSWFSAQRYKGIEEFDAANWLEHLNYRFGLLNGNPIYPDRISGDDLAERLDRWRDRVRSDAEAIFRDPLLRAEKVTAFVVHGGGPVTIVRGTFLAKSPGRAPLEKVIFQDILDLAMSDKFSLEEADANLERWSSIKSMERNFSISGAASESEIAIGASKRPVISVDLAASDSDLEEYFRHWLKSVRTERGLKAVRKNAPDYRAWVGYGVLPYLDLKIWGLLNGAEVTAQAFASALPEITGDHYRGADSVRDNTIPWARRLMESLTALEALAKSERDLS